VLETFDMLRALCRLAERHGRRIGGQGAVVFAQHVQDELREHAIKFFFSAEAFERESSIAEIPVCPRSHQSSSFCFSFTFMCSFVVCQLCRSVCRVHRHPCVAHSITAVTNGSLLQAIRNVMPPVFRIDDSKEGCSTQTFPSPLNARPLPPFIITEKGESLDEFMLRQYPDFFTAIQVSMPCGPPNPPFYACLAVSHHTIHPPTHTSNLWRVYWLGAADIKAVCLRPHCTCGDTLLCLHLGQLFFNVGNP
jgi:hypothetical protein